MSQSDVIVCTLIQVLWEAVQRPVKLKIVTLMSSSTYCVYNHNRPITHLKWGCWLVECCFDALFWPITAQDAHGHLPHQLGKHVTCLVSNIDLCHKKAWFLSKLTNYHIWYITRNRSISDIIHQRELLYLSQTKSVVQGIFISQLGRAFTHGSQHVSVSI